MSSKIETEHNYLLIGFVGMILTLSIIHFAPGAFQEESSYEDLNPEEFQKLVNHADTYTVDVHTPQSDIHIKSTDAFIPYNELEYHRDMLPEDKDKPIGVYCRSDNMSSQAAEELSKMGYKNVYNLEGGTIVWGQKILPFVEHNFEGAGVRTR